MSDFKAKMHQIPFWLGFRLRPLYWGAYSTYSPSWCKEGGWLPPSPKELIPYTTHISTISSLISNKTRGWTHPLLSDLRASNFGPVGLEQLLLIRSAPSPTISGSATGYGHDRAFISVGLNTFRGMTANSCIVA